MNKIIHTSTRLFMAVVGHLGSRKTELIFKFLKGRTFYPKIRNKLNRVKEAEVPQIPLQHLEPSFLPRNRRQQVPE